MHPSQAHWRIVIPLYLITAVFWQKILTTADCLGYRYQERSQQLMISTLQQNQLN